MIGTVVLSKESRRFLGESTRAAVLGKGRRRELTTISIFSQLPLQSTPAQSATISSTTATSAHQAGIGPTHQASAPPARSMIRG